MQGGVISQQIELKTGEFDWMATRLTSRKYYPPKQGANFNPDRALTVADLNPKPYQPTYIPGTEGMGVQVGKWKQQRALIFALAPTVPFADEVRHFASKRGSWNNYFNYWEIPILSQHKVDALNEVWLLIVDSYFELQWLNRTIELHWNYQVDERNWAILRHRIKGLNTFWETGEIQESRPCSVSHLYEGMSKEEVELAAISSIQELLRNHQWTPKTASSLQRVCVNYLRHKQSSYHLLLKQGVPYLKAFTQINQTIARAYPWLEDECFFQIKLKSEDGQ